VAGSCANAVIDNRQVAPSKAAATVVNHDFPVAMESGRSSVQSGCWQTPSAIRQGLLNTRSVVAPAHVRNADQECSVSLLKVLGGGLSLFDSFK